MVTPIFLVKNFIRLTATSASVELRPEVGSSQKSRLAPLSSPLLRVTRRFCPPEMPRTSWFPILVSATFASPKSVRCISITFGRFLRSSVCMPPDGRLRASRKLKVIVSFTVRCAYIRSSCGTYAETREYSLSRARPLSSTSPSYALVLRAARMSNNVDLPQPEGPMIAASVPGAKWPEHGARIIFSTFFFVAGSKSCTEKLMPLKESAAEREKKSGCGCTWSISRPSSRLCSLICASTNAPMSSFERRPIAAGGTSFE
mmetsp:Transcript_11086/g.23534  ORF Transcript_11086/g.23534 Transcript_11086/m.23534 type:complete len:259 (-) Transcript_11086:139-915(-)